MKHIEKKTILTLSLVVFFICAFSMHPSPARSEESISIEGEWYVQLLFNDDCYSVVRGNGGYIIYIEIDGQTQYGFIPDDGLIENSNGSYTYDRIDLPDGSILFYSSSGYWEHRSIEAFYLNKEKQSWNGYYLSTSNLMLFFDNSIIPFSQDDTAIKWEKYYTSDNSLFIISAADGKSYHARYLRGKVTKCSNDVFLYYVDEDPLYGERPIGESNDQGSPFYLFIKAPIEDYPIENE